MDFKSYDSTDEERAAIRAVLERCGLELAEGRSVVTNWIVVAERMDETGGRLLTQLSGDAADDVPVHWLRIGMIHEALSMLSRPEDDDESDE